MSKDYKKGVMDSINKWSTKQLPKQKKTKNKKPEKLAVIDITHWLTDNGFDWSIVEAKGVFNPDRGMYQTGQVEAGFSDIAANDFFGRAVYIEAKAKGKRSTAKNHQIDFLIRKINTNCFACVADSSEYLSALYSKWSNNNLCAEAKRELLLQELPDKKQVALKGDMFV